MSDLLAFDEAQQRVLELAKPLGSETLALADALGRCLASPLVAKRTQPASDLSAMDGYAVASGESDGLWSLVGESAAGHPFARSLSDGEAVRISTGAVVPDGADAVLIQENTRVDGRTVAIDGTDGPAAHHIRRAGFDFAKGDTLLQAGTRLGPAQLALARMAGLAVAEVHRLPSLTILDCGDELVERAQDAHGATIPATNGAMIASLAASMTSECRLLPPVADSLGALSQAFAEAEGDVIVVSGGASVGDHDLVHPALAAWGADLAFWRVAMRPGKPLLVATKGKRIVLGLPGNPVSAFVTATLFLLPLLRKLAGSDDPLPISFIAPLARPLPPGGSRTEFLRGKFTVEGIVPLLQRDSSALRSLAEADVLIRLEIGAAEQPAGALVAIYPIRNGGIA